MAQQLTIQSRLEGGFTVLQLAGEVDIDTSPDVRAAALGAIDDGADRLVIDLTDVSFIDSTGLGVFIHAQKKLRLRQGTLDLVATTRRVLAIFTIAGLDKVFHIHPTLESAFAEHDPAEPA